MAPRIRYPVPDLNEQLKPTNHVNLPPVVHDTTWDPQPQIPFLMETKSAHFDYNDQDDTAWQYSHMLGRGGYGAVGLWEKRNTTSEIIDTLAIKEMPIPNKDMYSMVPGGPGVPEEAIVQTSLQKKGCIPVVQLRAVRVLNRDDEYRTVMRYYLEYCSFGDLWNILVVYTRNQEVAADDVLVSVPEPFLWHLLYSFSQVMTAMETGPFDHPLSNIHDDNPFILHLDVKLENIMLGAPEDEDICKLYPACKVGDWGMATLTSMTDRCNSGQLYQHGTRHWHPPEQYDRNEFGADWNRQPPWRVNNSNFHKYTSAHTMFAFASIIFRLMVLDRDFEALDNLLEYGSMRRAEAQLHAQNFKWIDNSDMDFNSYKRPTKYSNLLKDTVSRCMNLNPGFRLSATDLKQISHDECARIATEWLQSGYPDSAMLLWERPKPRRVDYNW